MAAWTPGVTLMVNPEPPAQLVAQVRTLVQPRASACCNHHVTAADAVQLPTLAGLETAFRTLARAVLPAALEGRFALLVGEDTSGRIPALVLREVLNARLRAAGREPLGLVFLQGSQGAPYDDRRHRMSGAVAARTPHLRALAAEGGRALVITEWVGDASRLRRVAFMLGQAGVPVDVATLGHAPDAPFPPGVTVFSGGHPELTANGLYGASDLTGLSREKYPAKPVIPEPRVRDSVLVARRDVHILAARVGQSL